MRLRKTTKKRKKLTRKDMLRMIEKNGGPEGLDLSKKDLSGIDLGSLAIQLELEKWQESHPGETPAWYSPDTRGINLQKANLVDANLQEAYLEEANLQEATLGMADLQEANLSGANLKNANLLMANLEKVNLSSVESLVGVHWGFANLDDIILPPWERLSPIWEDQSHAYGLAKETYLLFKDKFNDAGHYDWAREAYIKEREMERRAHWPPLRALEYHPEEFRDVSGNSVFDRLKRFRLYLKYIAWNDVWTWSVLTFFKLTSMYGQRVRYVLSSGFGLIVLFAMIYPLAGVVSLCSCSDFTSWFKSYISSLIPSLIYSIASFTTLQLSSGYNVDTPQAQMLTSFEALLGIIWLAYFVYAFTNMMRSS